MTREQAFYQVAVALIPALLFGGAMVERAKPPDNFRPVHGWAAIVLLVAVLFGITAEVAAISALLSESTTDLSRDIVVVALVGGTYGLGAALLQPWLKKLGGSRVSVVLLVALLVASGVISLDTVRDSLGSSRVESGYAAKRRVLDRIQGRQTRITELLLRQARAAVRPERSRAERFLRRQELRGLQSLIDSENGRIELDMDEAEKVSPFPPSKK